MKPDTALGFALCGASLWFIHKGQGISSGSLVVPLALLIVAMAGLTLVEYITWWDFRIDQALFREPLGSLHSMPGRMSPMTALAFLATGLSLALLDSGNTLGRHAAQALACLVGGVSFMAVAGYAYRAEFVFSASNYLQTAIHTALGFLALSLGLIFARPGTGMMTVAFSTLGAGRVFHTMVLGILFLPLALGWLARVGAHNGILGFRTSFPVVAVGTGAMLLCLLWVGGAWLLDMGMARRKDQDALKEAYASLAASEAKARTLLEGAGSGLGLIDASGVIREVNRRWEGIFGVERVKIVGRPAFEFLAPQDRAYLETRMRKLAAGSELPPTEWQISRPDGSFVVVESFPAKVEISGEPHVLVALNDVTERNRLRRQASLNERLTTVGTLAAGIVHEINNPTAIVLGNLELLADALSGNEPEAASAKADRTAKLGLLANRALEGTVRIREIVGSIKGFARMDEDNQVPVDVVQVLESAVTMTNHVTKDKARVVRHFASGLPTILGNPGRLQQLFVNLLINAAQAMGTDPTRNRITLRILLEEEHIRIEIEDMGTGIPASVLPRVFDPFFTTKPAGEGTGLGLPICHEIVRQHGGEIGADSVEGKGTCFFLTLSTLRKVDVPTVAVAAPNPLIRILLVDDDALVLAGLRRALRGAFQVFTAEGGRAAIGVLAREDIQAIASDLNMPDINGVDLYCHVAEAMPALRERFVFFTGGELTQEFNQFLKGKGLSCMSKPFAADELKGILGRKPN